ncbi:MAG: MDR family oxidoreductase [Methyloligellaceae bacterium]
MTANETFKAVVLEKGDDGVVCSIKELTDSDLMEGDVTVDVAYSTINYKDGLAITNSAPIARVWPLVPGIDFSGTVTSSTNDVYKVGDEVVLNGWGVGEKHHGGLAQKARVNGDWLIKKPAGLSAKECMALGTAGYTAMLCVQKIEDHGVKPADGPILVTGASGGVGSVAIMLLAKLGYDVHAATGRMEEEAYLKGLGASTLVDRESLSGKPRPLNRETYAAAVDVAGGSMLANVISQIRYDGVVAACGLAQSMDLPASVAPFILRGITLAGVDSVMAPVERRQRAWDRLAELLPKDLLAASVETTGLAGALDVGKAIMTGSVRGRVVIDVNA